MKLKDLSRIELPREKLEKYGSQKLKDHEILAILLGSGIKGLNVLELSKKILKVIDKKEARKIELEDLIAVKGLGKAKATLILAALAFGTRMSAERREILSPKDVWNFCADIRDSKREHFVAFYLDTQNNVIERRIISIGTLNTSLVHPREVFEPAVSLSASIVIVAHNHPSGELSPSLEDKQVTLRLKEAGELLGIELADHIILTKDSFKSLGMVV
ncbi:MAG: DNA repair protein RadC [Patescibacteria group bacterium]